MGRQANVAAVEVTMEELVLGGWDKVQPEPVLHMEKEEAQEHRAGLVEVQET